MAHRSICTYPPLDHVRTLAPRPYDGHPPRVPQRALGALVAALSALLLVGMPMRALALPGQETFTFTWRDIGVWHASSARYITAADGSAAFCSDMEKATPSGLGISTTQTYANPTEAPQVLANVLALGYPSTTTIAGTSWSGDDAYVITQIAVWMACGALGADGSIRVGHEGYGTNICQWRSSGNGDYASAVEAAKALYQAATSAGRLTSATLWQPTAHAALQGVVAMTRRGDVRLEKRSTQAKITDDNDLYSLAGATYTIYSDAACNTPVATLTTGEDATARAENLASGTYWVRETTAPSGYTIDATTYPITVEGGATVTVNAKRNGYVLDSPLVAAPITVQKADTVTTSAQGDATLVGATFEVRYYDGMYDSAANLPQTPTRTWQITTADLGGYVAARLGDARCATTGDALYTMDGETVLPLGTVAVREVAAPAGYTLSDTATHLAQVVPDPSAPHGASVRAVGTWGDRYRQVDALNLAVNDEVVRGGVRLGKVDVENGRHLAQGSATLEGTVMAVELASATPVVVDGVTYSKGQVVSTVTLDATGIGATDALALPFGTYIAWEAQAPEGYLLRGKDVWSREFKIRKNGVVVDLSDEQHSVANQVRRGDLDLTKVAERTMGRLAGVPFVIESATTGEAHVFVTDDNGYASTATSWNAHTLHTNANDRAVGREGDTWHVVDAHALSAEAGVWFSGRTDVTTSASDGLGALPYDTYHIIELPVAANEGLTPVSFDVRVYRNGVTVGGGTVDDRPAPSIATTLTASDGTSHILAAAAEVTLVDAVRYTALTPGVSYELVGTLHVRSLDGQDMGPLADADGMSVTASQTFVPSAPDGVARVTFSLDASRLAGATVVAFEELSQGGIPTATHADIADEGQSVSFAAIETTLAGAGEKPTEIAATGITTVVDEVRYVGLTPGVAYTVSGTLMDKDAAAAATTANGERLVGTTTFTPAAASGSVDVAFTFDAAEQAGRTLVAFETLSYDGTEVVAHNDLENAAQTVMLPAISTTARDAITGTHEALASREAEIVDTVTYRNLVPGQSYALAATLADVVSGAEVAGATGSATFAPETPSGTVEVHIPVDASGLAGSTVAVLEELSHDGRVVAEHKDTTAEQQMIAFPAIATEATAVDGSKAVGVSKDAQVVDTVRYANLVPGITYELTGTLHGRRADGSDAGEVAGAGGEPAMTTASFTPESADGYATLALDFDATTVSDGTVVVFEQLRRAGSQGVIGEHADIASEAQAVAIIVPPADDSRTQRLPKTGDDTPRALPIVLVASAAMLFGLVGTVLTRSPRQMANGRTRRRRGSARPAAHLKPAPRTIGIPGR